MNQQYPGGVTLIDQYGNVFGPSLPASQPMAHHPQMAQQQARPVMPNPNPNMNQNNNFRNNTNGNNGQTFTFNAGGGGQRPQPQMQPNFNQGFIAPQGGFPGYQQPQPQPMMYVDQFGRQVAMPQQPAPMPMPVHAQPPVASYPPVAPQPSYVDQFGRPISMGQPMVQQQPSLDAMSAYFRNHNLSAQANMMGQIGTPVYPSAPLPRIQTRVNGSTSGTERDRRDLNAYNKGVVLKQPFSNIQNNDVQNVNNTQQVNKTIDAYKRSLMRDKSYDEPINTNQVRPTQLQQAQQNNQVNVNTQSMNKINVDDDKKVFMPGNEYPLLVKYGFKEEQEHQGNNIYTREVYQDGKNKEFKYNLGLKNTTKTVKDEDGKEIIHSPITSLKDAYLSLDMAKENCLYSKKIDKHLVHCTGDRFEIEHLNRELKIVTKENLGKLIKLIQDSAPQLLHYFNFKYTRMFNNMCKFVANTNVSIDNLIADVDQLLNYVKAEKNIAKRDLIYGVLDHMIETIHNEEINILKEYDNDTVLLEVVTSNPMFFCLDGPTSMTINDHFLYSKGREEKLQKNEKIIGAVTDVSFKELFNMFEDCDATMFQMVTVSPYNGIRKMYTVFKLTKNGTKYLVVEN